MKVSPIRFWLIMQNSAPIMQDISRGRCARTPVFLIDRRITDDLKGWSGLQRVANPAASGVIRDLGGKLRRARHIRLPPSHSLNRSQPSWSDGERRRSTGSLSSFRSLADSRIVGVESEIWPSLPPATTHNRDYVWALDLRQPSKSRRWEVRRAKRRRARRYSQPYEKKRRMCVSLKYRYTFGKRAALENGSAYARSVRTDTFLLYPSFHDEILTTMIFLSCNFLAVNLYCIPTIEIVKVYEYICLVSCKYFLYLLLVIFPKEILN